MNNAQTCFPDDIFMNLNEYIRIKVIDELNFLYSKGIISPDKKNDKFWNEEIKQKILSSLDSKISTIIEEEMGVVL